MLESRDVSELFPSTLTAPLGCTPHSLKYSTIQLQLQLQLQLPLLTHLTTGVNPAGDAGDTSPNILVGGTSTGISLPLLLRTFGYSRPILVALRSLSLKPISFGYKTPPIRLSQAGGQSAHKARPPTFNSR